VGVLSYLGVVIILVGARQPGGTRTASPVLTATLVVLCLCPSGSRARCARARSRGDGHEGGAGGEGGGGLVACIGSRR
jgi:hypothetical protein